MRRSKPPAPVSKGAVSRVTGMMSEITVASNQQSQGIEQIGQAIAQMDGVTQQNAALVEEASASAVAGFKLNSDRLTHVETASTLVHSQTNVLEMAVFERFDVVRDTRECIGLTPSKRLTAI